MNVTVYDTEANGFYEEATTIWCGCVSDLQGDRKREYGPNGIYYFMEHLRNSDIIVCHNQYDFDIPLMEKLYGFKYEGIAVDTLVMSRLLRPPQLGGRYGLEEYGKLFGVPKPVHEDWTQFSEEMLHRCSQDVEINRRALLYLMKHGNISIEDLTKIPEY